MKAVSKDNPLDSASFFTFDDHNTTEMHEAFRRARLIAGDSPKNTVKFAIYRAVTPMPIDARCIGHAPGAGSMSSDGRGGQRVNYWIDGLEVS